MKPLSVWDCLISLGTHLHVTAVVSLLLLGIKLIQIDLSRDVYNQDDDSLQISWSHVYAKVHHRKTQTLTAVEAVETALMVAGQLGRYHDHCYVLYLVLCPELDHSLFVPWQINLTAVWYWTVSHWGACIITFSGATHLMSSQKQSPQMVRTKHAYALHYRHVVYTRLSRTKCES